MMGERAHALDHILGARLVSTLNLPRRRPSKAELARMAPEDRILAERELMDMTDAEKTAELEREDRDHFYQTTGEVDAQDILDNRPPPDWGE
jgi:hypothetical protein